MLRLIKLNTLIALKHKFQISNLKFLVLGKYENIRIFWRCVGKWNIFTLTFNIKFKLIVIDCEEIFSASSWALLGSFSIRRHERCLSTGIYMRCDGDERLLNWQASENEAAFRQPDTKNSRRWEKGKSD